MSTFLFLFSPNSKLRRTEVTQEGELLDLRLPQRLNWTKYDKKRLAAAASRKVKKNILDAYTKLPDAETGTTVQQHQTKHKHKNIQKKTI